MIKFKKFISIVLIVSMMTFAMPALSSPVSAATNDDLNVLSALGIDTNDKPDGYSSDGSNPYGTEKVTVNPVLELYTGIANSEAKLYGNDLKIGASVSDFYDSASNKAKVPGYDGYTAVAGDFTGDGLAGQVVTVGALMQVEDVTDSEGKVTQEIDVKFDMYFTDPTSDLAPADSAKKEIIDFDKGYFGNQGRYDGENISKLPYQLQNYLQIAAGDFTGDGIDEIAVYIPERGKSRVEVYQLKLGDKEAAEAYWQTADKWELLWTHSLVEGQYVSNMVSLAAGDMTGDGFEDLAITWGVYYGQSYKTSCQAVVLHGSNDSNFLQTKSHIDLNYSGSEIVRASIKYGDANNDNKDELVLGGQLVSDINSGDFNTRFLALYRYNDKTEAFVQTAAGNMDIIDPEQEEEDGQYYSSPACVANLAIARLDGVGTQRYIYLDSVLFKQDGNSFVIARELDEKGIYTASDVGNRRQYVEYGAMSGDYNGDGHETVITMQYFEATKGTLPDSYKTFLLKACWWITEEMLENWGYDDRSAEATLFEIGSDENNALNQKIISRGNLQLVFAVPNTDNDTTILAYTGHHQMTYTDPKILAVLASPPYFSDLEHLDGGDDYIGNSETVYGVIEGSSSSNTSSSTISAGTYMSFSQEISFFGISLGSVEAEAEYSHSWTTEMENTRSMTQTVEYGTSGGQDTVVLYSIPMDIYYYDAYVPVVNGDSVTWEKQTMTINKPYNACIKTFTLEDYDAIAASYAELPQIGGDVLTHTLGDPSTYPASTAGYSDVNMSGDNFIGVGYGTGGFISQTIELTEENSVGTSQTNSISTKAGAGAGGVTVGVTAGYEASYGKVHTNLAGKMFSTTIVGMPEEARNIYNYSLKAFQYTANKSGQNFPVVNYLVADVSAPPKLPQDFEMDVEKTTDTSVTLNWSGTDATVVGYQIYRHYDFPDGAGDYPIGDVIETNVENKYSFTDENLNPYTEYSYRIQVINGVAPYYSVTSDLLTARTKASEGQPTITLSDYDVVVYPDKDTTVTATVDYDPKHAGAPLYQWQKKVDGEWSSLTGKIKDYLTFASADITDIGEYRLRVNQFVGDKAISAYSKSVMVSYAKRNACYSDNGITITPSDDPGSYNLEVELSNESATSGSLPTGLVTFEIKGNGYFMQYSQALTREDTVSKALLLNWHAPKETVYEITAYYGGNRIFNAITSETRRFLAGAEEAYLVEMDEKIVYGNEFTPSVLRFYYDAEGNQQFETFNKDTANTTITYRYYRYEFDHYETYWFWRWPVYDWNLLDVELGDNGMFTPSATGNHRLEVSITQDNKPAVELSQNFTVEKRPITISAPFVTVGQEQLKDDDYVLNETLNVSTGSLAFDEKIRDTLGLYIRYFNTGGKEVSLDENTKPGIYTAKVYAPYSHAQAQANYQFTYEQGEYIVIGTTYAVNQTAELLLEENVGYVHIISPDEHFEGKAYQASTSIIFEAMPKEGYVVESWEINGTPYDMTTLNTPNVLPYQMPAEPLNVNVIFKVAENTLTFRGDNNNEHGHVICTSVDFLKSGATVIKNAEYTFKAIPKPGYHFKEWQLFADGTSYPVGSIDEDGFHTYDLTMDNMDTTLTAIFERDSYSLAVGEHLIASYMWDHDDNVNTDLVKTYIASGSQIVGDTEITVEPVAGYQIDTETLTDENGEESTEYLWLTTPEQHGNISDDGQSYTFNITEPTAVSAGLKLQQFTMKWNEVKASDEVNTITITVNGEELSFTENEAHELDGSSEIVLTATPAYGVVFAEWQIGDDTTATYSIAGNVLTCSGLDGNLDVTAVFEDNDAYTLSLDCGLHGELTATLNGEAVDIVSDEIAVYEGDEVVLTATPDSGYMVDEWYIDDDFEQKALKTLVLDNITSDMDIEVDFTAMVYYEVTFDANDHGSIAVVKDGEVELTSGDKPGGGSEIVFTATPDDGYMVEKWSVNGETFLNDLGETFVAKALTIDALSDNMDVVVSFIEEVTHTVTVTDLAGVSVQETITPDDYDVAGTIREGASYQLTVTPDEGYRLDSVVAESKDEVPVEIIFDEIETTDDGVWTCTLNRVDQSMSVTVEATRVYDIVLEEVNGGTATISANSVPVDDIVTVTATSAKGYKFSKWEAVDEFDTEIVFADESEATTTFTMPAANVTVTPKFKRKSSGSSGGSTSQPKPEPKPQPEEKADATLDNNEQHQEKTTEQTENGKLVTVAVSVTPEEIKSAVEAAKQEQKPVVVNMAEVITDDEQEADQDAVQEKAKLTLTSEQVEQVAEVGLAISGPQGTQVELPKALLNALTEKAQDLNVEISKVSKDHAKKHLRKEDTVYEAREIDTNFSGETNLRFTAPADAVAEELKIKVIHSDGTEEEITPTVVTDDNGNNYLEFSVNKFSTFIVYKPGEVITKEICLTLYKTTATIDGESFTLNSSPFVKTSTNRTLVPIRFVSEALSAEVEWLSDVRQVRITSEGKEIVLTIGSDFVFVDGAATQIDSPAEIVSFSTFVPLRFVSETLGAEVEYKAETKEIVIIK